MSKIDIAKNTVWDKYVNRRTQRKCLLLEAAGKTAGFYCCYELF